MNTILFNITKRIIYFKNILFIFEELNTIMHFLFSYTHEKLSYATFGTWLSKGLPSNREYDKQVGRQWEGMKPCVHRLQSGRRIRGAGRTISGQMLFLSGQA